MGARALSAIAIATVAANAAAEPRSAMVEVAPACAQVVDTDEVVVALRVELGSVGVGSVSAGARGDVALAVDCPSPHEVVIAVAGRRTSIVVADIAPPARARVVALTVAEQLRPSAAPDVARTAEPPPVHRWEAGARVDGVIAHGLRGGIAFATLARRSGAWTIQPSLGFVGGLGNGGGAVGGIVELRGAVEPLRVGRVGLGASLGVLGVATRTYLTTGKRDDSSVALRGEPFARLSLGPTWSGYAAAGLGRAFGTGDWFATFTIGASAGL